MASTANAIESTGIKSYSGPHRNPPDGPVWSQQSVAIGQIKDTMASQPSQPDRNTISLN
ncbi:hypothetical protein RESH_00074 [Rhodopirellula europaea SH398]|uniref:Uncharacterized protein n=1 Tax=Rhodopirellula europaea SH398 TaxID=1263868 RepID=M5SSW3_9BACT|nr:hypothetical protein RESH_00074 [Rhodopirellula europaea SH398]